MIDERTEEEASLYALGALSPDDQHALTQRLAGDEELRELVRDLRSVAEAVAGASPALEPAAAVKARVLLEIGATKPAAREMRRGWNFPWLPWSVATACALLSAFLLWQRVSLQTQSVVQAGRIQQLSMANSVLRSQREGLQQVVQSLRDSNRLANVRIAVLNSLLGGSKAVAVSIWDSERQSGVFVVRDLKPPPADKDYQLWVIDPQYPMPVDAGVFHVDASGNVRLEFRAKQPVRSANQFAVTLERKGGSPVPTVKAMVLAGT